MGAINVAYTGTLDKTAKFLDRMLNGAEYRTKLDEYGRLGKEALANATPQDTGLTAESWDYRIVKNPDSYTIEWFNTNVHSGEVVAILIQYGHGTGTGGYVAGIDYVNPAIKPIFDGFANGVWEEVIK